MTLDTTHPLYLLPEVCSYLRMDERSVRRILRRRKLAYIQDGPGATIRVSHEALMEYVGRMTVHVEPEKERTKKPKACG
jgi:excisionase family DNA binding protein